MGTLPHPQWHDVADVLLISYVAHRVILLFRGTRAPQVLLALAMLWAVWEVARRAGLELTGWFLGTFNELAAIAIIVIFRDEIREVLFRSNPLRLLIGRPDSAKAVDLPAVAEATFRLAEARIGALLAFEVHDSLDTIAREGVRIDARFGAPLVESLFAKESPVHDGAAIVRRGRIARVGTFLPLSNREGLPANLGTRHRAAVGLSELCDAVVLVVSEERGEASLVHRGRVERIASPEELEHAMGAHLRGEDIGEARRGRAAAMASSAFGFLLTVLAVSAVWAAYNSQQVTRKTIPVPIEFRGVPESLELISPIETIDIQVRGKQSLIDSLSPERLSASVDLGWAKQGGLIAIKRGDVTVDLPAGVEWSLSEDSFAVELSGRIEVTVPVRPQIQGRPPPGFALEPPEVEPATVTVSVPRPVGDRLEVVETEPIDLDDLDLGPDAPEATLEVALDLGPPSARPVGGSGDTVRVTIRLRPAEPPAEG